jgi:hypothetical protein
VLWKITDEFCPRTIVTNGIIQSVSTIGPSDFRASKLWLPSQIKIVSSKSVYQNKSFKSVVIENMSNMERIESKAFGKTDLQFLAVPVSVKALSEKCFSQCKSLSSVTFESGSALSHIAKSAFFLSNLFDIILPATVRVLGDGCFCQCESLSSVTFE